MEFEKEQEPGAPALSPLARGEGGEHQARKQRLAAVGGTRGMALAGEPPVARGESGWCGRALAGGEVLLRAGR